jgi:cathepsin X
MSYCRNCAPSEACVIPEYYYKYDIDQYGSSVGESAIMNELYQRGPLSCAMATTDAFHAYKGGIFYDDTGDFEVSHEVSIVGYGE